MLVAFMSGIPLNSVYTYCKFINKSGRESFIGEECLNNQFISRGGFGVVNVENVCRAIDMLDMDYLWNLALSDPVGVLRKISIRQIGRKRITSLLAHIKGMEHKTLGANKSFYLLIESLCLEEIGTGMFTKANTKSSSKSQHGENQPLNAFHEVENPALNVKKKKSTSQMDEHLKERKQIIDYLNEKTGKTFRYNAKETIQFINRLFKEGYTITDFKKVIDNRVAVWVDNPDFNVYLNPSTLFRPSNFEKYLNAKSIDLKQAETNNGSNKRNHPGNPDKYENFYL